MRKGDVVDNWWNERTEEWELELRKHCGELLRLSLMPHSGRIAFDSVRRDAMSWLDTNFFASPATTWEEATCQFVSDGFPDLLSTAGADLQGYRRFAFANFVSALAAYHLLLWARENGAEEIGRLAARDLIAACQMPIELSIRNRLARHATHRHNGEQIERITEMALIRLLGRYGEMAGEHYEETNLIEHLLHHATPGLGFAQALGFIRKAGQLAAWHLTKEPQAQARYSSLSSDHSPGHDDEQWQLSEALLSSLRARAEEEEQDGPAAITLWTRRAGMEEQVASLTNALWPIAFEAARSLAQKRRAHFVLPLMLLGGHTHSRGKVVAPWGALPRLQQKDLINAVQRFHRVDLFINQFYEPKLSEQMNEAGLWQTILSVLLGHGDGNHIASFDELHQQAHDLGLRLEAPDDRLGWELFFDVVGRHSANLILQREDVFDRPANLPSSRLVKASNLSKRLVNWLFDQTSPPPTVETVIWVTRHLAELNAHSAESWTTLLENL